MTRKGGGREPPEPCIDCGKPMTVTGRNVVLGGIDVGTTWQCDNPDCFSQRVLR